MSWDRMPTGEVERDGPVAARRQTGAPGTAAGLARLLDGGNGAVSRLLIGGQVRRCGPVPCDCDEEERLAYQALRHATGAHAPAAPPPEFLAALGTSRAGRGLPEDFRVEAESRFDADLSRVRLHTDAAAGEAAEIISASAFTVGDDVFFARGEYRPEAMAGRRLLAHELTHVVQGVAGGSGSWVSHPDDPAERAAEFAARRFMSNHDPISSTVDMSGVPAAVRRDGPTAPAAAPAANTSTAPDITAAVRAGDVAVVVRLLGGHAPAQLAAIRAEVNTAIGAKLETWLLSRARGSEAVGSIGRALSWASIAVPGAGLANSVVALLGGGRGGGGIQAEQGIRTLWPALKLIEKLQLYDEGWRELEQAQLDVIRAAGLDERAAARQDPAMLERIYALMDPKEEFEARSLIDPTPDGRYEAAQRLLNRAAGEEDAVFDAMMDLTPAQRRRFFNANLLATARLFDEERRTLFRNLCYDSEAQALIARLREATEGRFDDMAAVQKVVDKAVSLLQERASLRASLAGGSLSGAERATVEARVAELNDLDQLLTFGRGRDGQLESSSFMGMLSAARGDAGAFATDAQRLGQFATGENAVRHARETAVERIRLSGGNVDAIESAIMQLHAPRATAPGPGELSAADQEADQRLRQQVLDDPAVASVISSLTGFERMLVGGAVTADAFDETKNRLSNALRAAEWGTFFRLVLTIARDAGWRSRFQETATSPMEVYAQVHGEPRAIMEEILRTQRVPVDAVLSFTGDAEVLATAFGDLAEDARARLREGYFLTLHPPAGPPTPEQTRALEAFRDFDGRLKRRWHWYRAPLDPADYQKVLWAALGQEPTMAELSTGEGRFRAVELMYQQQQGRLGLDRGVSADFTESDETLVAAAREFASRFEPLRAAGTLSAVDFAALAALHDRFSGRAREFTEASQTISEMAGVVAATVAGAVVVAATGGTASPAVIALAAAAGAGSRVVTQEMFGADYNDPNARQALLGAIDGALAVVSGSLAARGAELTGLGGRALASGAARVAGQVAEQAGETAARAAPSLARRVAASGVESALDGAFSGAVSDAFGQLTDPATWRRGVWNGLVQVGQSALTAGLTGLGTGGLLGAAAPAVRQVAGRLWNAVVMQGIEHTLERAGKSGVLAEARAAARAGNLVRVNEQMAQLEAHLSAAEATALRRQLSSEMSNVLGHPPGRAEPNAAQRAVLEETAGIVDGTQLRPEHLEVEFDIVRRSEPQPSTVDGYLDEVDLGNGHTWRRREDGTWCRFSDPTRCGTRIPGTRAVSEEVRARALSLGMAVDSARLEARQVGAAVDALPGIARKFEGRPPSQVIDLGMLTEHEQAMLAELWRDPDSLTVVELRYAANHGRTGGVGRAALETAYQAEQRALRGLREATYDLYTKARKASPSQRIRDRIQSRARKRDPVTGEVSIIDEVSGRPAPSGVVEPDHTVPLREIVDMDGFKDLDWDDQLAILNYEPNFMAVDRKVNGLRKDTSWAGSFPSRGTYSAEELDKVIAAEERLRVEIREMIAARRPAGARR